MPLLRFMVLYKEISVFRNNDPTNVSCKFLSFFFDNFSDCRYSSHPTLFREDGFFFICHNDRYVATAFAWQEEPHSSEGRLHWLAVMPEYQRQGLGRALALCVLRYHKEHGKTSVFLKTEPYREAAIKLYKDIGFVLCDDQGNKTQGM